MKRATETDYLAWQQAEREQAARSLRSFMVQSHVDEIAERLGKFKCALRAKGLAVPDTSSAIQWILRSSAHLRKDLDASPQEVRVHLEARLLRDASQAERRFQKSLWQALRFEPAGKFSPAHPSPSSLPSRGVKGLNSAKRKPSRAPASRKGGTPSKKPEGGGA